MGAENEPKGRDKTREFLKSQGKDPDKFLPRDSSVSVKPESSSAGSAPSAEIPKTMENIQANEENLNAGKEDRVEIEKRENDEKRILNSKDEDLSDEEKQKKKELIQLKIEEAEARREANVQKRIDELVGDIKALKAEKSSDQAVIKSMELEIQKLRGTIENNPEKIKRQLADKESQRIQKYLEEDRRLPREERREMTKEELEDWMVEDLVAAQEWLTDRNIRRRDEKREDQANISKGEDKEVQNKAEEILKKQKESQSRVIVKHPELDISRRLSELRAQGKSDREIREIIHRENPKVRMIAEILRENEDKYMLNELGPELLVEEMERRMSNKSSQQKAETADERERRIADEAAEAERNRQKEVDTPLTPRHSGGGSPEVDDEVVKDPLFSKQLEIWKKNFPKLSEKEVKARLIKRLKERRSIGAS